tara:strand:+ start:3086 stop:3430 length:345 start_codon:yes stop_codon:yes gene_type:complete
MAHYAFLDPNNIVTEVIVGINETELIDGLTPEQWYGDFRGQRCVRTSYNNNIRFRYAGFGYTYNEILDAFIAPQPFPSWTLNEQTTEWDPPTPQPEGMHYWDEQTLNWIQSNIV